MEKTLTTRERLIEAAISIIESEGEGAIRVDQVADRAGFTKPVLYHYFENREDIIVAAHTERYARALRYQMKETKEAAENCTSPAEFAAVMKSWLTSFATQDGETRRRIRIEALGSAVAHQVLHESLKEANRNHTIELAELLKIAQYRGWLTSEYKAIDLAIWWVGLTLSRYLPEVDKGFFNLDSWDSLTHSIVDHMLGV